MSRIEAALCSGLGSASLRLLSVAARLSQGVVRPVIYPGCPIPRDKGVTGPVGPVSSPEAYNHAERRPADPKGASAWAQTRRETVRAAHPPMPGGWLIRTRVAAALAANDCPDLDEWHCWGRY
jgi:hypothetical protein